jgi:hypothetical protein
VLAIERSTFQRLAELEHGESLTVPSWPVDDGSVGPVHFKSFDPYASGATIYGSFDDGMVELPRSSHKHFLGTAVERPGVFLMAWVDPVDSAFGGVVSVAEGAFELIPVVHPGEELELVQVALEPVAGKNARELPVWSCDMDEGPDATHSAELAEPSMSTAKGLPSLHTAVIAVDTDNELMSQKFANSTSAATDYIADLFALMNVIYERDLNVRLLQGDTILRIAADPWEVDGTGNADSSKLYEFRNYWINNYSSVDRALAMLLSGKQGSSYSASGIAFLNALCSTYSGYSFNQVFKINYTSGDAGLVAHELGHNFGSHHTHCYSPPIDTCYSGEGGCYSGDTACPDAGHGTLMSYCHHKSGCGKSQDFHPRVKVLGVERARTFTLG